MRKNSATHRVSVLALPGVVAFDLTIATHVFGHEGHGRYATTVCGLDRGAVATTTTGLGLTVAAALDALGDADTVIVPGFARGPAPASALHALQLAHRRGARIASICTGAFALAEAGLLDGLRATTHWAHAETLAGSTLGARGRERPVRRRRSGAHQRGPRRRPRHVPLPGRPRPRAGCRHPAGPRHGHTTAPSRRPGAVHPGRHSG
ncbi:DJ-1/PfpI family protein [Micromonospora sp. M12]